MSWQVALGVLVVINTASIVLTKVAADKLPKRSLGIFYQYLICTVIAITYAVLTGKADISSTLILVGAVGFINAFGNYFQWQASGLSLSKTVLFFPLMEVMTIVLAIIFIEESIFWNPQLILGAGLCFLAMWFFRLPKGKGKNTTSEILSRKWLFFTLAMVVIFGVAGFLVKFFSFQIASETFLMGWYIGALLGSLPMLGLEKQNPIHTSKRTILVVLPVSLTILGALFALYWTYQLGGPVSFVLPVRGLAITIIPVLSGWFIFKERKRISRREWLGFLAGIAGAVLVLLR